MMRAIACVSQFLCLRRRRKKYRVRVNGFCLYRLSYVYCVLVPLELLNRGMVDDAAARSNNMSIFRGRPAANAYAKMFRRKFVPLSSRDCEM